MTSAEGGGADRFKEHKNLLVYSTPERAAKVLSKLYEYQRYLKNVVGIDTEGQQSLKKPSIKKKSGKPA